MSDSNPTLEFVTANKRLFVNSTIKGAPRKGGR